MDINRYIRLCSLFNEEYLSNYDAKLGEPLIWFREWYTGRLYWI